MKVYLPPAFALVALLLSAPMALPEAPALVDGTVVLASRAAFMSDSIVVTGQDQEVDSTESAEQMRNCGFSSLPSVLSRSFDLSRGRKYHQ